MNKEWFPHMNKLRYADDFFVPVSPRLQANRELMPARQTSQASAFDVRYIAQIAGQPLEIRSRENPTPVFFRIPLGITLQVPADVDALIFPRSSLYAKHGLLLTNSIGLIDSDFNGNEIWVNFLFIPDKDIHRDSVIIQDGERIVQIKFTNNSLTKYPYKPVVTARTGGHGSTGRV